MVPLMTLLALGDINTSFNGITWLKELFMVHLILIILTE